MCVCAVIGLLHPSELSVVAIVALAIVAARASPSSAE